MAGPYFLKKNKNHHYKKQPNLYFIYHIKDI